MTSDLNQDATQDALLALIERGAFSSMQNPWHYAYAQVRARTSEYRRRRMEENAAWCEVFGIPVEYSGLPQYKEWRKLDQQQRRAGWSPEKLAEVRRASVARTMKRRAEDPEVRRKHAADALRRYHALTPEQKAQRLARKRELRALKKEAA